MSSLLNKIQLLKGLLSGESAYTGPFFVSVDVTRRCNLQCICCPIHSPLVKKTIADRNLPDDLSFDLFKGFMDSLNRKTTNTIILEGEGEPLLHGKIQDFVSLVKQKGFQAMLFTNGTLLNDTQIRKLIDSGLDILKVSLWAGTVKDFQLNYPGTSTGTFKKIIDGLKRLSKHKTSAGKQHPRVELCCPINRNNFKNIDILIEIAAETGCDAVWLSPLNTIGGMFSDLELTHDAEKAFRDSFNVLENRLKLTGLDHNLSELRMRYHLGPRVWENFPCYISWFHTRIRIDGTVQPCYFCEMPMGNIRKKKFPEIWNDTTYRIFRKTAMTKEGLRSLASQSDCNYCTHAWNNKKVYNFMRWFPVGLTRLMPGSVEKGGSLDC